MIPPLVRGATFKPVSECGYRKPDVFNDSGKHGGKVRAERAFLEIKSVKNESIVGKFPGNGIFALLKLTGEVYNYADHRFKRLRKH